MGLVCFHNPDEENGYLSNWYPSEFEFEGVAYSSMEQYMMHRKALCFGDDQTATRILGTDNPAEIKRLGREVLGFDEGVWCGIRQIIVYEGLIAKFSQDEGMAQLLLATGGDLLAECSVSDRIWGIGLSMNDARRFDRHSWKGQNLLGYALVMVRKKLTRDEVMHLKVGCYQYHSTLMRK